MQKLSQASKNILVQRVNSINNVNDLFENTYIREAKTGDYDRIWEIFSQVLKSADSYALLPSTSKSYGFEYWFTVHVKTFVICTQEGFIIGVYRILANNLGFGNHIANASYIVDPCYRIHGVGEKLAEHSFIEAKKQGYMAMQFNFVVSTNHAAVHLWKKVGFNIIGVSPKSYKHTKLGLVDTYIMHRYL